MSEDKAEEKIDYQCPGCDSKDVEEKIMVETFLITLNGKETELSASVPVICCKHCDQMFTDFRGEEIRAAVIKNVQIKVL